MRIFDIFFKPNVIKLEETKNIEGLTKALNYQKCIRVRKSAVNALARIKDPIVTNSLIRALDDTEHDVRIAATDALAQIKDPNATDGLITALNNLDRSVQKKAIEVLGELKDAKSIEPLINIMETKNFDDFTLWVSAAKSLGKIKDQKAVDPLLRLMKTKATPQKALRVAAVDALVQIKDPKAVEGLTQALKHKDGGIRKEAERGLREIIGTKAVDAILIEVKDNIIASQKSVELKAVRKAKLKLSKKIIKLISTLENSSGYIQSDALKELGDLGATEAVEPIINLVSTGDLRTFSASEVLNKIDSQKASVIIREKMIASSTGRSDWADMLIDLNDTSAIPLLKKYLDRGDFSHISWGHIAQFIEDHPEIKTCEEKQTCTVCHTERPVTQMKGAGDQWFCFDQCWKKRGTVLPTGIGTDCPLFNKGLCSAGNSDSLCSLIQGHYSTDCHVYAS